MVHQARERRYYGSSLVASVIQSKTEPYYLIQKLWFLSATIGNRQHTRRVSAGIMVELRFPGKKSAVKKSLFRGNSWVTAHGQQRLFVGFFILTHPQPLPTSMEGSPGSAGLML